MAKENAAELIVSIRSTDELIWEGSAQSVSSKNSSGKFDVLPGHANFITIVEGDPIVVDDGQKKKEYKYSKAVLYVKRDTVKIYADI